MKNSIYLLLLTLPFFFQQGAIAQCEATASASSTEIQCGQSVVLTAFGQSDGTVILDENFDSGGFGPGWGSTPGATNFSNPCSPGGVDGTPHAWMDNNTSVPRTLISNSYDLTAATAGVTICFDMLFAEQGGSSPCEGPDESDEGVYLEYSIDGGTTWTTIHYFDPNGGNDPDLVNWNNWCFQIPAAAITANTQFRWHQTADSGAEYDHWGIDNVEIYQNDVNAELVWQHDGYSYGTGNPGGDNTTPVSPTTTTTYTVELTTGGGATCTDEVTIVVQDPTIESTIALDPNPVCVGECADFVGDASWVIDPGGIETYENNQTEVVLTGEASVDINIQDLNMTTIDPGSIQEICVNDFNFSGTQLCSNPTGCSCNGAPINFGDNCNLDASSFDITLSTPDGCSITLVPAGNLTTTGLQDMCFIPSGGDPISSGSGSYTGQFDPTNPLSDLDGCTANGAWTLDFDAGGGFSFGGGSLGGWNITFDDPPITQPVNPTWTPTTNLSDPTILNPEVCPPGTASTTYTLELDNGTPGCATYTEDFTLDVMDPCVSCTPPSITTSDITICSSNTADLNDAVDASSDPATITFFDTQSDANNETNAIGSTVSSAGSYWIRAEDPSDATCFDAFEVVVNVTTVDYTPSITDANCGASDGEIELSPSGGDTPYTFSIDDGVTTQGNGTFLGLSAGTYDIVITDGNGCFIESTEIVGNIGGDDASFDFDNFCAGETGAATNIATSGGVFTFNPVATDGASIDGSTGEITDGVAGTDYTVEYTTSGSCANSSTLDVSVLDCPDGCDAMAIRDAFTAAGCVELDACVTECSMYFLNPQTLTGSAAQTFAEGLGANLVSVQSQAENDCILNALTTLGESGTIWIGFNDEAVEGTFEWYDQSPVGYTNWAPGEPNQSGDEDCVQIYPGGSNPGMWNDLDCASNDSKSIIEVNLCPVVDAGPNITICEGETATMQSNPTILGSAPYTYQWDNNGPADYPNSVTPDTTTNYILSSEDRYECSNSDTMQVVVNEVTVSAGNDTTICLGETVTLSADSPNGATISWDNGITDGTAFTPSAAGTTTYTVTADSSGCTSSDQVVVNVEENPSPDFFADELQGCKPHTVTFVDTTSPSGAICTWDFGDGTTSADCDTVTHTYTSEGMYDVSLTIESSLGCTGDTTLVGYIEVENQPTANFTADPTISDYNNTEVDFTNESDNATNYIWDFDDSSPQVSDVNPNHQFPNGAPGDYIVTLLALNDLGCADTASILIKIIAPDINYSIPNVFTPNGDGDNDFFKMISATNLFDLEVVVLNRWGNLVFESDKVNFKWNGLKHNNGAECSDGTYFYKIKLKNGQGKEVVEHGFVQLSRGK